MQPSFAFRHLDATDGLKEHTSEKLQKLNNYLRKPESLHVIFSVEHIDHKVEITLLDDGEHFVGHAESPDMYASIDQAVSKLKHQLQKRKDHSDHNKKSRPSTASLVS